MNSSRLKLLAAGCLLTSALCVPAPADIGTVGFGATNSIAANATTSANLGNAVKIDNSDTIALMLKFQGNAAGTDIITVNLARSADGTTFETTPKFSFIAALNGTTAVVAYTNLASTVTGGAGWLKITSIVNASATVTATNASLTLVKKRLQ